MSDSTYILVGAGILIVIIVIAMLLMRRRGGGFKPAPAPSTQRAQAGPAQITPQAPVPQQQNTTSDEQKAEI